MKKSSKTRDRILARALDLATREGLEGVTIGRLSGELKLSKSGIHAHFGSKATLQRWMLGAALDRFMAQVVRPSTAWPEGKPRLKGLFGLWMEWVEARGKQGGCLFLGAAMELDDRPGEVREALVRIQRDWRMALMGAVRICVDLGHFQSSTDPEQFAFEMFGIIAAFHHWRRLLGDRKAGARARSAFRKLVAGASA